jgi:hypothetical protein
MNVPTRNVGPQLHFAGVRTNAHRAVGKTLHSLLLSLVVVGGIASGSALARAVIVVDVAPPAQRVEVVPVQRHGYTWAPGYWRWQGNKHVWVNGHSMRTRSGYHWAPDRWNEVNGRHQYEAGHWTR